MEVSRFSDDLGKCERGEIVRWHERKVNAVRPSRALSHERGSLLKNSGDAARTVVKSILRRLLRHREAQTDLENVFPKGPSGRNSTSSTCWVVSETALLRLKVRHRISEVGFCDLASCSQV